MNLDPHFICYTKINSTWTEGLNEIIKALKDQEKNKDIESLQLNAWPQWAVPICGLLIEEQIDCEVLD